MTESGSDVRSERIERLLDGLAVDDPRLWSLLAFVRGNPVSSIERFGGSVLVRGRSDRDWVYVSSADGDELKAIATRLTADDRFFAAVEPWSVPILCRGRALEWSLEMVRFVLPESAPLPALEGVTEPLVPADVERVFERSDYAQYISPEYARSRILAGPSAAVREEGELVAWAMTQDDGALGFLTVLERCRGRGLGRRVAVALAAEQRRQGRHVFAYVSAGNRPAIALVSALGFERGESVRWFGLR